MNHRKVLPLTFILLTSVLSLPAQNNSPPDKPVAANDEQLKKFEDAIAPYVKKAREALPGAKKNTWRVFPRIKSFTSPSGSLTPRISMNRFLSESLPGRVRLSKGFLIAIYQSSTITQKVKSLFATNLNFWIGLFPSPTVPKKAISSVNF